MCLRVRLVTLQNDRMSKPMALGGRIGAFKPVPTAGMTVDQAEGLAASALAMLAEDPARLIRFMSETGMGPADLQARAGDRDVLAGVLEHVMADESLLLLVATSQHVKPEALVLALAELQTPALVSP